MPRKLRVSVNSSDRPSGAVPAAPVYVTQYHWPRIIAVAMVLLLVLTALYLWLSNADEPQDEPSSEMPLFADAVPEPSHVEPAPKPAPAPTEVPQSRNASSGSVAGQGVVADSLGLSADSLASSLSGDVDLPENSAAGGVMSPEFDASQSKFRLSVSDEPVTHGAGRGSDAGVARSAAGMNSSNGVMETFAPSVLRAVLTSDIADSEPGESLPGVVSLVSGKNISVHVFAQVKDLEGAVLRIIWYQNDEPYATIPLIVRTASAILTARIELLDSMSGVWRVELQDDSGKLLSSGSFTAGT